MNPRRRKFYDAGDGGAAGDGAGDGDGGGAPTGDGGGQPAPGGAPNAPPGLPAWMVGLPVELQADKSLHGYKSIDSALTALSEVRRDLRTRPKQGAIVVPDENSTEAQRKAYHEAMGIPDDSSKYEASVAPANDPARPEYMPTEAQQAANERFRATALEMGLTQAQAKRMAQFLSDTSRENVQASQTTRAQAETEYTNRMQELYGTELQGKLETIGPLHSMFGAPEADGTNWWSDFLRMEHVPGQIGNHPALKRFLINVADKTKPDRFVRGQGDPGTDVRGSGAATVLDYSRPGEQIRAKKAG